MKQRRIGEASARDGGLATVTEHGRAVALLTVHGERGGAGDRCVWRVMATEGYAVGIEQTNPRLLDDLRRHVRDVESMTKTGDVL